MKKLIFLAIMFASGYFALYFLSKHQYVGFGLCTAGVILSQLLLTSQTSKLRENA